MKIIFMGSPDFSVPVLDALVNAGHDIACVYCQPPRPAGRGKKDRPTAVHKRADELGLNVRHPKNFKAREDIEDFHALGADIAVVVAYGLILPQAILDAPKQGCLNIHASLLPRWRGAAPIHRAILSGDKETGVCIMQMDAGLDTGDVLLKDTIEITATTTTPRLHDDLSEMGAKLIVTALEELSSLKATPQPEDGVTYAQKIDKSEARIDWQQPAEHIDRQIRALTPFPGAWALYKGERFKFHNSKLRSQSGAAGEVIDGLQIACGEKSIEILSAQREGKRAMSAEEILKGLAFPPGSKFE